MREKIPGFCEQKYQEFLDKKRSQPEETLRREQVQEGSSQKTENKAR